jgi:hypothetical protein
MSDIQIDKGVEMPSRNAPRRYPFDQMEVGDSFALSADSADNFERVRNALSGAIRKYVNSERGEGTKFATRKMDDEGDFVIRCWRVE